MSFMNKLDALCKEYDVSEATIICPSPDDEPQSFLYKNLGPNQFQFGRTGYIVTNYLSRIPRWRVKREFNLGPIKISLL